MCVREREGGEREGRGRGSTMRTGGGYGDREQGRADL